MLQTALSLALVLAFVAVETLRSRANERALRARGAVEPPGDVYGAMQVVYPAALFAPFAEAALTGPATPPVWVAGVVIFLAAKMLKFWVIAALGPLWSFRVLVLPGTPLVVSGPYRFFRHPNYIAVISELAGAATMCAAPAAGTLGVLAFGVLLRRRIQIEERALTRSSFSSDSTRPRYRS
jgi:methyltransferase